MHNIKLGTYNIKLPTNTYSFNNNLSTKLSLLTYFIILY